MGMVTEPAGPLDLFSGRISLLQPDPVQPAPQSPALSQDCLFGLQPPGEEQSHQIEGGLQEMGRALKIFNHIGGCCNMDNCPAVHPSPSCAPFDSTTCPVLT